MHSASTQSLLDLLRLDLPIIQAPMAGVSSPAMAAAVSSAGGLGSIAVGAVNAQVAGGMIRDVRQRTSRPFNVNLFVHQPAAPNPAREAAWIERFRSEFAKFDATPPAALREIYQSFHVDDAMLAMLLAERPAIVSFHFGLPSPDRIRALRAAGITLLASATCLAEARLAANAGVDAIVAQGFEAGGHRGIFDPHAPDEQLDTHALTRLLAREWPLPIIAAGGLMNGADIALALRHSAAAAQLGTAFVAADESLADAAYRAALFSDAAHNTVMTRAISGRPARSLPSCFTALAAEIADTDVPAYPIAYDLGKALHAAAKAAGQGGYGAWWAGTGAPRARAMPSASLVMALADEIRAA